MDLSYVIQTVVDCSSYCIHVLFSAFETAGTLVARQDEPIMVTVLIWL